MNDVKFKNNKPNQLVIGPGIMGIKLPISPIKQNNKPIIKYNMSIKTIKIVKYKCEFS